ncbi:LPS assembly lipoprotein LptE [Tropicimonas marinistellae]|uniref:LPS assembly lipoprotein LptE n=1 Tax=Tropicimonas marinistellae TaxID=1739787 RepID=UPI00082CC5DA|nr:LPS assembly lipoprotein LptE [Tropicimonas marinistellae]
MSWSDRRKVLAALAAAACLSGCGFTPVYAPGGAGDRLHGQILADAPGNRDGYTFVAHFEDRLGRATDAAPFALAYEIDTDSEGLAVTPDQETLRYQLTGTIRYRITDRATGRVLTSGQVNSFTSYSAIGTTVATRASQTDAEQRLMVVLADQLVARLLASADGWLP